jgi:uncharacterized membrane protein YoaK (UPF0700 family)
VLDTTRHELRRTLVPGADEKHGPLPPLLVGLTLVTGLVDAFSYLTLGHVFVANMTGNVVILGFALAGAHGFSIGASATALLAFWAGAYVGGALGNRFGSHRGTLLSVAMVVQASCLAVGVVLALLGATPFTSGYQYPLVVVLAVTMGVQNATARRLAVPGLTTTVLTLTITSVAADAAASDGASSPVRRYLSVLALFIGALSGAMLVVHAKAAYPLAIALALTVSIGVVAWRSSTPEAPWGQP